MKISKALLGAILVGVAVQTTATSCTKKEQNLVKPQPPQVEQQSAGPVDPNYHQPWDCPACGQG